MNCEDATTEKSPRDPKRWGVSLYFCLLAVQTAGLVVLLANSIPLYRLMALDFANYKPDLGPWWAIAGILLIQVAYWLRVWLQPLLPRRGNMVLGHIILFAARITFVSVTASFTVMFLQRFEQLSDVSYPPLRVLAVLIMFFSIFCWTLEAEGLAKALQESKHENGKTHRD